MAQNQQTQVADTAKWIRKHNGQEGPIRQFVIFPGGRRSQIDTAYL